jgi:hypothetical protein
MRYNLAQISWVTKSYQQRRPMPLRRPPTQKLQVDSFIAVQNIVNEMNCEFRKFDPDNAGIDAEIDLVKDSSFEGKSLKAQLKAGRSYISSETRDHVKVKVEKKYVELWKIMNVPVLLLFYHPDSKVVYWKSIQDYLRCDPKILKDDVGMVIFPLDKERDIFSTEVLNSLRLVVEGKFKYDRIIYVENAEEEVISNWFPVISLPDKIYTCPTPYQYHRDIANQLETPYTFIIKERKLYSFSDLTNEECELLEFCDYDTLEDIEVKRPDQIPDIFYMELLNRMLVVFALRNQMNIDGERFYFSPKVLKEEATTRFDIKPLRKEKETSRLKIYIHKPGKTVEYQHMAVKLSFLKPNKQWYLQVEPDWHFSYPYDSTKTRKDIGVRITKEKAGTYNEQYLYLLHAWKQYLSNNSPYIIFNSDHLEKAQEASISVANESFTSNFMLFNDYSEPRKVV